jgi:hypothetical protein
LGELVADQDAGRQDRGQQKQGPEAMHKVPPVLGRHPAIRPSSGQIYLPAFFLTPSR